ncbi:hypothetical protein A1F94_007055 [Pyrenophora tritici-repentis]|nr:hypothetical protein A1F94_007055 [Pyrenophora tritici-repentis]
MIEHHEKEIATDHKIEEEIEMKGFVEREKVRQAEQEEQAKEAREKLEVELENDGKVRLDDICGK